MEIEKEKMKKLEKQLNENSLKELISILIFSTFFYFMLEIPSFFIIDYCFNH